jgi:hypothetical protein
MYVGQRQHPRRVVLERREERLEAAAGPRIDDDLADTPGADDLGAAQVKQVDELGLGDGRLGRGLPAPYERSYDAARRCADAPRSR